MDHDRGRGMGDRKQERKEDGSCWTMDMVSSSMGTINSLLKKLPAEPGLMKLRRYLDCIQQHLLGFCARGVVVADRLDRHWMKLLRELAYGVEDWIDTLHIQYGRQFKLEWDFSVQEFEEQILYLQDLGQQFGLLKVGFADLVPSSVTLDLEDTTSEKIMHDDGILCQKKPCIVGLSDQECVIVQHLMDDEKELKVVSILGPGGVGKTTLARGVFQKQRSQFDCGAIVYVGRYPSIDDTLMDVARQVTSKSYVPCGKKHITIELLEFLQSKRYLIVIDGIWTIDSWTHIACAFPHNKLGSRILATTEVEKLANFCRVKPIDFISVLKPLADCESRLLLLCRMSSSEEDCLNYSDIIKSVLKVCCGNPLAIVVAAGLLDAKVKATGQPRVFENNILSMMKQDYGSQEVVTKILDMSYSDLPLHLKSCFLYLSAFPENCTISKDRLIRRWMAEGFIPSRKGESLWAVGESYFKELARRGLIQLVLNDINDEIGCTVHNIIHEFIRSLSTEENFVTVGEHLSSRSYPAHTVRRFTHDCSRQFESRILASMMVHLSKVRSLAVSGNTNKQLSDASEFKLVRVLDLEGATGLRKHQLRSIGKLVLLRYLGLRGSDAYRLPEKMNELKHLETVDLRRTKVNDLPRLATAKLVSLLGDRLMIPRGMDNMFELQELSMIVVSHGYPVANAAQVIGKSKLLRVLGVKFESCEDQNGLIHFFLAVMNSKLQKVVFHDYDGAFFGLLEDCSDRYSCRLEIFELNLHYLFSKVPERILYLHGLTHLHIRVRVIKAEGLHVLEHLFNLVFLDLDSHDTLERCIISNKGCFRSLKVFCLRCLDSGMGLQFGPGVMPQLRRFKLVFGAKQTEDKFGDFDFGIENLICLEKVSITINCSTHASEAAIRDQVSKISNNPLFELISILAE